MTKKDVHEILYIHDTCKLFNSYTFYNEPNASYWVGGAWLKRSTNIVQILVLSDKLTLCVITVE